MNFWKARSFTISPRFSFHLPFLLLFLLLLLLLLLLRTSNPIRLEFLLKFVHLVGHIDWFHNSETTMELVYPFDINLKHKLINSWVLLFQRRVLRVCSFVGTMVTLFLKRFEVV